MTYEVGTHIDLKTGKITPPQDRREAPEPHRRYAIGTQFTSMLIDGQPQLVMKIPVMAV